MTPPPRSPRCEPGELYEAIETGVQLLAQSSDAMNRAQAALEDARRALARANAVRAQLAHPSPLAPRSDAD